MTSMSGYITYLKFTAGSQKGNTHRGDVFNTPFSLAQTDAEGNRKAFDDNYTSAQVISEEGTVDTEGFVHMHWNPVIPGTVDITVDGVRYMDVAGDGILYEIPTGYTVSRASHACENSLTVNVKVFNGGVEVPVTELEDSGAKVIYQDAENKAARRGTIGINGLDADKTYTLRYSYNNVFIPQNDLPLLNAEMAGIPITAKARRIAIYYSQIAAFQAKEDYGFNLADQLAQLAVGRLAYEIDTEIINMLVENAPTDTTLTWSRTPGIGISITEHYIGFAQLVARASQVIYARTQKFQATYMVVASDLLPILTFAPGFTSASYTQVNGPFMAGTLNGIKVFVSPTMEPGTFIFGVNNNSMYASAAVYAPYMAIVPTQLLQYADGGTSLGFSTLYGLAMLNKDLLVKGKVVD